jgi:hypothetical protein
VSAAVKRVLAVVELADGDSGVSVDEGPLVDAPDAFERADVESILRAEIVGVLRLDLAVSLLLLLGALQRLQLILGQDQASLRDLRRQGFEPPVESLQVVAQPDAAHPARGDEHALLLRFIRGAKLTVGRLLKRHREDGLRRARTGNERFVVDKRGEPQVVILSVDDFVRNVAPETEVLAAVRAGARRKGKDRLSPRAIDREIRAYRRVKRR